MKVSVLIITYNHEAYITEAIESALAQDTNFDYEIIIGEDASTDRTREIVLDFQKRYPDKIKVLLSDPANSARDRESGPAGKTNFVRGFQACTGQYIALLDGDDHWTDTHKLQKQVDFLDRNQEFAIACHNVKMFYQDGSNGPAKLFPPDQKEIATIEDLIFSNFISTSSVVFRRGLFAKLPDWFNTVDIGDWALHLMNADQGKIRYFPETLAVYRVHHGGLWSGATPVVRGRQVITMLDQVDSHLGFRYKKTIKKAKAAWYFRLAETSHLSGDRIKAREFMRKYLSLNGARLKKASLSLLLRMEMPALYRNLISLRNFIRPSTAKHSEVN